MAILKTEGIVLKGWNFGETSKILSLYTRDVGKLKVIAKGGRGLKSKFKGCLEPLTHLGIVYYHKPTRDLQLLSHADLIDPHIHIVGDVRKTALGLSVAELLNKGVVGEESAPAMFDLFCSVLSSIDQEAGYMEGLFWFFESHFIGLMGYKPTWDACIRCSGSLSAGGGYFQSESGGLLCQACGSGRGGLLVSGETLEILFWLQRTGVHEVGHLSPTPAQQAEIRKMFDFYFKTHIDHMGSLKALKIFYELNEGIMRS
jgi:DNA repair protein RecO (recombination protein O)